MNTYIISPIVWFVNDRPLKEERQIIKRYAFDVEQAHDRLAAEVETENAGISDKIKRLRWFAHELKIAVDTIDQLAEVELEHKGK